MLGCRIHAGMAYRECENSGQQTAKKGKETMKTSVLIFIPLAFATSLTGCTEYRKSDAFGGGFSEVQIGENVWKVEAESSFSESRSLVSEIVLLRSADLAIQNGYRFFVFAESKDWTETDSFVSPLVTTTTYGHGHARSITTGGTVTTITEPKSSRTVIMFKARPEEKGLIYDAQFVCRSLGQKLDAKCGEIG